MASPPSDPDMRRHERFYFSDGSLYLIVENSLYRIHRSLFEIHASKFPACGLDTSSGEACSLKDVNKVDFDRLLACLYPRALLVEEAKSTEEWISILKLASKWGFESLQSKAISQIEHTLASPIDKVVFGRQYNIPDILFLGYATLCQGTTPLSSEDGRRLGVEDVINIYRIRHELYRSAIITVSFEEALEKVRVSLSNEEQGDEKDSEAEQSESDLGDEQSSEWTDAGSVPAPPKSLAEVVSLHANSHPGTGVGPLYADPTSQTSPAEKDKETVDSASNTSAGAEELEDQPGPVSEDPSIRVGIRSISDPKLSVMDATTKTKCKATEKAEKVIEGQKDPKAPKHLPFAFSQVWRKRIKAEHPNADFDEVAKLLREKWKELEDEEKKPYVECAAQDKNGAEKEMGQWDANIFSLPSETPLDAPPSAERSEAQEDSESEEEWFDERSLGGSPAVDAPSSSISTVTSSDIHVPESSGPGGQVFRFLDELAANNFDSVTKNILHWFKATPNSPILYQITQSIVERATEEQPRQFNVLIRLCKEMVTHLSGKVQIKVSKGKVTSGGLLFRDYLGDICRENLKSITASTVAASEHAVGIRRLRLIEFIAKLTKLMGMDVWSLDIIDKWVTALLDDNDEEKVATLCMLMTRACPLWDKASKKLKHRTRINGWFEKMSNVALRTRKPQVRTLIQDVIRCRNLGWVAK